MMTDPAFAIKNEVLQLVENSDRDPAKAFIFNFIRPQRIPLAIQETRTLVQRTGSHRQKRFTKASQPAA
jgi:hypothetical protein